MKKPYVIPLLFLAICLCACAKKVPAPAPAERASADTLADLRDFPQNLATFAKEAGPGKILLNRESQARKNARFNEIFFGPWHMRKSSIARREAASVFGSRARGYKNGPVPWSQAEWDAMRANAGFGNFPSQGYPAITLGPTDLRELPTHEARFSRPTPDPANDPFDYIQYARLPIGTPLFVVHTSQDGRWHYVECPVAGGWVDAKDVARADPAFRRLWQSGEYAAIIKDNVLIPGRGKGGGIKAGIGTILPVAGKRQGGLAVLTPVRVNNGGAGTAETILPPGQAVIKPMPMTAANVAAVGDAMLGQKYGWGGIFGLRDCSSMIRDLFTPFGLWLPRNSRAQARAGTVISLAGMDARAKETAILRDGEPFMSLVGMPGHITLYVGAWKNRPALFHNVWGLRIIKDGNDDERFVIGRAVVTSITPGMELDNLYRPVTFADRIKTLTTFRP